MCILCILFYFTILTYTVSAMRDCIAGEIWYETCKKCTCQDNGTPLCELHRESCSLREVKCTRNIVIFNRDTRCHCSKYGSTICVPLSYQPDLDGKPCIGGSYYYDNCTFCQCDSSSNITKCTSIYNCNLTRGGICNYENPYMENCYKCLCTFSKFRVCRVVEDCSTEKPGKCRSIQNFYPPHIKDFCLHVRNQECYSDYGCPGKQKCCQIVDCFLRCVDPS